MAINFAWNPEKNELLVEKREISFNEVANAINEGRVVDNRIHPNQDRYPGQRIYYVEVRGYIYMAPFVVDADGTHFLKTVIPSRRATRYYLGRRS